MIIALGIDAQTYQAQYSTVREHAPKQCPGCGGERLNVHGTYPRKALDYVSSQALLIQRLKCMGCKKTISQLPWFLHRHRHYPLEVMREVVEDRVEQRKPWAAVGPMAGPSDRTRRRWVKAFVAQAPVWLGSLLAVLATVKPATAALNPHGKPESIFALMRTFAGWLAAQHAVWPVNWQHGWNTGVGRLI